MTTPPAVDGALLFNSMCADRRVDIVAIVYYTVGHSLTGKYITPAISNIHPPALMLKEK